MNPAEELIKKYLAENCNEAERALVESWHLQDIQESKVSISNEKVAEVNSRMRAKLLDHANDATVIRSTILWPRLVAAAITLLVCALGTYFYKTKFSSFKHSELAVTKDISTVGNKATLTLADGSTIDLSGKQSGIVINSDAITYVNGAAIAANSFNASAKSLLALSTPVGAQYQVVLADGTKIWLNGSTRIRYPAAFGQKLREIQVLEGEVYLEVAHNPKVPFHIAVNGQEIEVLGTSFNINAYSAQKTITTLINGSVKVKTARDDQHLVLVPGEESVMKTGKLFKRKADLTVVTAWKENYFHFKNEPLENVMNQVAQWYGVSIKYDGNSFDQVRIGGFISRSNSLKTLLALLEETGDVSLELQDRTVIVKKRMNQ